MTTNHFNGPFLAVPVWAVETIKTRGQSRDLQVLIGLIGCMDLRTRTITATFVQVADHVGVSRETVKRAIHWLESEGIIRVERTGNSVGTYTVFYKPPRGVTGDLPGGHGRPPEGSRETPPTESQGVTGDPSDLIVSPAQGPKPENTDIYVSRDINKKNEKAPCGSDGGDMILGGDPHEEETKVTSPKKKARPVANTYDLANKFMYHPKSLMSRSYTPQDRVILMATFKKLLAGNLTRSTVVKMIDRFWNHPRFSTYSSPVEAFSSLAVQKALLESTEIKVQDDNPVLNMMANDFTRTDEQLPWDSSADSDLEKAVIMRCMDACYRYPEVVASIAVLWHGDFKDHDFLETLEALNSLVRWHCSQETINTESVLKTLSCISLPDPLLNTEPTMLRPPAGTIKEAVYNYRRFGDGR